MWEETVPFDEDTLISDETERDDFVHCKRSDFKILQLKMKLKGMILYIVKDQILNI